MSLPARSFVQRMIAALAFVLFGQQLLHAQLRIRVGGGDPAGVITEPNAPKQQTWDPAEVLIARKVPGTAAGAVELLQRFSQHTPADRDRWLKDLDAEEYHLRESAMQQLIQLPAIPREEWLKRLATELPEGRWRLRHVLDRHDSESTQVYRAALQLIAREPAALSDDDWLVVAIVMERADLRDEFSFLLQRHMRASLLPEFRAAATAERLSSRLAAAIVISRSTEVVDRPLIAQLLADRDDQVSLLTAQGVAQRGEIAALSAFIRLLDSPQVDVRREAALWLCGLTGQEFDYSPYAAAAERQATMARWREWLAGPGTQVVLQPPQRLAVHARGSLNGHTLIATGGMGKVCELDTDGNITWQLNMQAWSAEKLPGGNVLVASHWENRVCEFDNRGQVVWQLSGVNAIRAKPLPGGRVLIADFGGNRVVEADSGGNLVWEHGTPDQCFDAERLHNGNTIFACPNLVREVAPDGSSVRQWTIEGRINSLQVLPSGRLLTANYGQGRVVELDDESRVTWEYKIARPSDAFRLPGGRTLITTAEQIVEIDLQGRQIRQISAAVNGGARQ
ncbi:hypothetical protein ETAA8_64660 [Anatilimnocola aggregata]|uniref:Pyrrolo-quinoline quinone repeat domain-containing protein n=1 Tax=Anatilimnocola aggregata TaxID=2528021 RepID=A0A517YM69_9BACT|nr:PQQ-binding-like beta-propeller repeat protein [Anatilimnocola aggregata]QDU31313.1 hypothetical protein ETAA8_64660 [Anatilimnocola aggregata]